MSFDPSCPDIRCEWGKHGVAELAPVSDIIVIVDIMSFSTCVSIATARGATVYPHRWKDASASERARSLGAELAGPRGRSRYSLRPAIEDWLGAGAILHQLSGRFSPEAQLAAEAFDRLVSGAPEDLPRVFRDCASGRELSALGFEDDIALCAEMDAEHQAAILHEGAYRIFTQPSEDI